MPKIAVGFIGLKTFIFSIMLFWPRTRKSLRNISYFTIIFFYVTTIFLIGLSEYFFWNEFGVRFNFIAVDYLIYTNEVIGNIFESYPVIPMFSILAIISVIASWFIFKKTKSYFNLLPNFLQKIKLANIYLISLILSLFLLPVLNDMALSENVYTNELKSDGSYKFYTAFINNQLSYHHFYDTLNHKETYSILKQQMTGIADSNLRRTITDSQKEVRKNIVLISVESLSASFMKHFGSAGNITPFLDSLADKSILFTNLYATGNRTVRGIEALTLCMPPSPGESIIKRTNNSNLFTIGSILRNKGYQTIFLYGGYSYFDNMKSFYLGNGYNIVDRDSLQPKEINFANIWGVCDENMARKCIDVMNAEAGKQHPFFCHWMTVSNHRPFTFPKNRIDISPNAKSRYGAVKYTDYAIRIFFQMAQKQSWFKNTIFVIVADHCASSSGKVELPIDNYHIPAIVFAKDFVQPQKVNTLMSQIDLMPSIFGLLHFSYKTYFLGENIFDSTYKPRAFISTYQSLGYLKDSVLTVLSPVRQDKQFTIKYDQNANTGYIEEPTKNINVSLKKQAISFYQTTAEQCEEKRR